MQTDRAEADTEAPVRAAFPGRRQQVKALGLVLVVACCVALFQLPPVKETLGDLSGLLEFLHETGPWAAPVFLLGASALTLVGCPRALLCLAAGMTFPLWQALLLSTVASLLGSYLGFLAGRWGGREWVLARLHDRSPQVASLLGAPTVLTVVLARLLPVTNMVMNLVLSVSGVSHGAFLLGSLLGFLPLGIAATLSGGSLVAESAARAALQLAAAMGVLGLVALLTLRLRHVAERGRQRQRREVQP